MKEGCIVPYVFKYNVRADGLLDFNCFVFFIIIVELLKELVVVLVQEFEQQQGRPLEVSP